MLSALEGLASHESGRRALVDSGLAADLNRALDAGWLQGALVGRARALRDMLSPSDAGGRWRPQDAAAAAAAGAATAVAAGAAARS